MQYLHIFKIIKNSEFFTIFDNLGICKNHANTLKNTPKHLQNTHTLYPNACYLGTYPKPQKHPKMTQKHTLSHIRDTLKNPIKPQKHHILTPSIYNADFKGAPKHNTPILPYFTHFWPFWHSAGHPAIPLKHPKITQIHKPLQSPNIAHIENRHFSLKWSISSTSQKHRNIEKLTTSQNTKNCKNTKKSQKTVNSRILSLVHNHDSGICTCDGIHHTFDTQNVPNYTISSNLN